LVLAVLLPLIPVALGTSQRALRTLLTAVLVATLQVTVLVVLVELVVLPVGQAAIRLLVLVVLVTLHLFLALPLFTVVAEVAVEPLVEPAVLVVVARVETIRSTTLFQEPSIAVEVAEVVTFRTATVQPVAPALSLCDTPTTLTTFRPLMLDLPTLLPFLADSRFTRLPQVLGRSLSNGTLRIP
jgi:hypothetical protein